MYRIVHNGELESPWNVSHYLFNSNVSFGDDYSPFWLGDDESHKNSILYSELYFGCDKREGIGSR